MKRRSLPMLPLLALVAFGALPTTGAAKQVRVATFNIENGPDASDTTDYKATKAIVQRINADIVAFQEVDRNKTNNWRQMATELGYTNVHLGTIDSSGGLLGFFSRFPLVATNLSSVSPANEFTRRPMRVVVQVPGAARPLVMWNMHHKADDFTPTNTPANQFRRAIEAHRIVQDINAYRSNNPTHTNLVMLGDLNENIFGTNSETLGQTNTAHQPVQFSQAEYTALRSNTVVFASSYQLGADITFPVPYRTFPDNRYGAAGLQRLNLRQQNGTWTGTRGGRYVALDYILVSTNLTNGFKGEIYNSEHEPAGLSKAGSPLATNTSELASDHFAVFADIQMQDGSNSVPLPQITSISPDLGLAGSSVTLRGTNFTGTTGVAFAGLATTWSVVNNTEIATVVPANAVSGAVTVQTPAGTAIGPVFTVGTPPGGPYLNVQPRSLPAFATVSGTPSAARTISVRAGHLTNRVRVSAPTGFEVSRDGVAFSAVLEIPAGAATDVSANYTGAGWANGSNGGSGFAAWSNKSTVVGSGLASAYLGNPADSGVTGMGTRAFALRAEVTGAGVAFAGMSASRRLESPMAIGETLRFDWGINWDSGAPSGSPGSKGFAIRSAGANLLNVSQGAAPGDILFVEGPSFVATGITNGTGPMTWSFTQVSATILRVTATGRGTTGIVFTRDINTPGVVDGFVWEAAGMDPDARRRPYFDNLRIEPAVAGGGFVAEPALQVRLAANAPAGTVSGNLAFESSTRSDSVPLQGEVTAAPQPSAYDTWIAGPAFGLGPESRGRAADPDRDGFNNWMEFALGGSPVAGEVGLFRVDNGGNQIIFTFLGRGQGIGYSVEKSNDLTAGFAVDGSIIPSPAPNQDGVPSGWSRRQFSVPATGAGFYRIRAVEN